jgi:putative PIN family toxin of toxin-antitoxin system
MTSDKLRIVCDTNVLLSMLGFPGGRLDSLWEIIQNGDVQLFLSEFILQELAKNLRVKVRLETNDVQTVLGLLKGRAKMVEPTERIHVVRRKDSDNRILECAVAANAQVLVTGNFKDLVPLKSFQGIAILAPRAFLDHYFPTH